MENIASLTWLINKCFAAETIQVEVKDPPQGVTPPTQNTPKKMGHQPNKVSRKI